MAPREISVHGRWYQSGIIPSRNHALVDGNKRLAWTACRTFLDVNDQWTNAPEDDRFDFVIRVATGEVPDLDDIAEQLRIWSYQE
ncbi:hypothetical protein TUM20985_40330 [Mycobacterium antarcticum]|nr:hypothetical protein TUM20985_40330 [Mycolicibacterium sp. TUM20985]GLP82903.1 hypothetical protein TUM20984_43230 [Mycolicibacterium sp. TUM20984]